MSWQFSDLIDLKALLVIALIFIPLEALIPHRHEQRRCAAIG